VNAVLEVVRLDADRVQLHEVAFNAAALVDEVARLYQPQAQKKGIALEVERGPASVNVRADAGKVRQILQNLVANAIQYTDEGHVRIVLEDMSAAGAPHEGARRTLRFSVEDTGVGLSPEDLARIYEPFARFGNRPAAGTGLGLPICRRLALTLGGELVATSELGCGSRFSFHLTCSVAAARVDQLAPPRPTPPRGTLRGRVLVVEDNPVNREVARLLLRARAIAVDFAEEGHAALKAIEGARYDLVLMDCQMPGLDGYETARLIRQRTGDERKTPIVAMTASALEGDRERCLAAGMNDYLAKPVTVAALDDVLRRYVIRE
jgi:hypothetical protein